MTLRGVALDEHVGGVVLARVLGVEVDGHERGRLRHREVLGLHAVEVGADADDDVGLVPQRAGGGDVSGQADEARVVRREHAGRAVGGEHGGGEALGEVGQRAAGVAGAGAGPDQRPLGLGETRGGVVERAVRRRAASRELAGVGRLDVGAEQVGRDLEIDRAVRRLLGVGERGGHGGRDRLAARARGARP